jgi:hypothetical protein
MSLRHDLMAGDAVLDDTNIDDTNIDDALGDTTIADDELFGDELAELVEFTAAFLAWAEGPLLRSDFARFSYGAYTLDQLRADLWRLGAWIRGNA